jgi:hypothetical protein
MNRPSDASYSRGATSRKPGARGGRLVKASVLGALSCAVATAGLLAPVEAAVSDPHTVFVLKNDSIVEVEGLQPGEQTLVEVLRNGVVVGSVNQPASNPGGTLIINHDLCWDNFTPEILPGDVVRVTTAGGVDRVPVTDIHVTEGPVVNDATNSFTIKGRVTPRIAVGNLLVEARTNDPIRFRPLAPDTADGVTGRISYDAATGGAFTATFTGLTNQQVEAAHNLGEFSVAHVAGTSAGGDPKELTMATEGSPVPGPGCGLSAPVVRHAVTSLSMPVINKRNVGRNLRVSGMTLNATNVQVRLADGSGPAVTKNVTPSGASAQTWTTSFTPQQLSTLNGRVRVSGVYTSGGEALRGATMSLLKDTVAPRRPSASPRGGTFFRRQAVSLNAQPGTQIRYTLGTRQPAPRLRTGSVYRGRQLRITATQTLKAIAVDRAGNVSRLLKQRYVIR